MKIGSCEDGKQNGDLSGLNADIKEITDSPFHFWQYQLLANEQNYSFSFKNQAVILAHRGNDYKLLSFDAWDVIATLVENNMDNLSISCSKKKVTISSSRGTAVGMIILAR